MICVYKKATRNRFSLGRFLRTNNSQTRSCMTARQRRQVYSHAPGLRLCHDILHACFAKKQMIRFALPRRSTRISTIAP
jgi:hypothetical protein